MKKIFFIVIGLYISISGLIILFKDKESNDYVEILSIKKDYARIITENETIDIPVYISSKISFFTTKDNIIDAKIESELDEIEIEITNIENQKQKVTYQEKTYFLFYFEVSFNDLHTLGLKLDFSMANIVLTYVNDEILSLELGDMNIIFQEIYGSNHLNYSRMYSIHDQDAIIGLYIDFINKTGQDIKVMSIDVLNKNMYINLNKARILYEPLNHIQVIDEILPGFKSIVSEFPQQGDFIFKENTSLFIPIQYLNDFNYINRFPLLIRYEYNDKVYDYIIGLATLF